MAMRQPNEDEYELEIQGIEEKTNRDGSVRLAFRTTDGRLDGIMHPVPEPLAAVILVGGAGGGFNGPAGVYEDLAHSLAPYGITTIRLDYRIPNHLEDCILDAVVASAYLEHKGIGRVGIVGWSFGGAVAISAAALQDNIKAVATIATQSYGTNPAKELKDKPILLLHGSGDRTLPIACSEHVYGITPGPKELKIYEGANHGLDQVRGEMLEKLKEFFAKNLVEEQITGS